MSLAMEAKHCIKLLPFLHILRLLVIIHLMVDCANGRVRVKIYDHRAYHDPIEWYGKGIVHFSQSFIAFLSVLLLLSFF